MLLQNLKTAFRGICLFAALAVCFPASAQYAGFSDPSAGVIGGVGIVPVEPSVDGGTVPIGATAQVVIRFRNDGSQPVETGVIQVYPSSTVSATTSLNQCGQEPLPSGAECAIALSVKGLQAGPWRVEMLMAHSGRTRLVTATLSGLVEPTGDTSKSLSSDIETIPEELDFGTLNASQSLIRPVILRNITSNAIDIEDIYVDAGQQSGFALKTDCEKLQPGQACIANIRWAPKLKGPASGVLVVQHNGPASLASVLLEGEYRPDLVEEAEVFPEAVPGRGLMVASQKEINFGDEIVTASAITVSLVNAGDAPLTIRDIRVAGSDNGVSFKAEGCTAGLTLDPIEACPLTVTWSPTRVGLLLDDIQILHDGARGILVLPVRGESLQTVSQDQKAIVLAGASSAADVSNESPAPAADSGEDPVQASQAARVQQQARVSKISYGGGGLTNPASLLDGLKITSFAATRAIIAGPGGSRIVFDDEDILLGGVLWSVDIQKNGIEFDHQGQKVLLLFDRSLSTINRISSQSGGSRSSSSAASGSSSGTGEEG